jgi:cytochrome c-type biogenesis protein
VSNWTQSRFGGFSTSGISGQFGVGMLLGAVWTPCVGPTLGAASIMAARGQNLGMVVLTTLAFGIGTSLPLLALALMSREALLRWRSRMLGASSGIKMALGALLVVAGVMTLSGFDRTIQIGLEQALPDWLVAITTSL